MSTGEAKETSKDLAQTYLSDPPGLVPASKSVTEVCMEQCPSC